jgi:cytochrome c biogenesis protein CcdA
METLLFAGSAHAVAMVLLFGAGVLTPFFMIGIVSGSILQEQLIRYSRLVQKASGVLLIVFGIWLVFSTGFVVFP